MIEEIFFLKEFGGLDSNTTKENTHATSGKCLLHENYSRFSERILNAPVRKDDVWLVSYPRTGSTWCQEMIWLITNNLDFETAQSTLQQLRAPLIETSSLMFEYFDSVKTEGCDFPIPRYSNLNMPLELLPSSLTTVQSKLQELFSDSVKFVEFLPSPRCIKSHLTYELLPEQLDTVKPKVIYTMRNPKDLCISYYFHLQMVHKFRIGFEEFCTLFLNGALPIGSVFHHYLGFWNKRHQPNILILRYEEMRSNTREVVKKIASHLNKSLTDEDVDAVCEFLSFQNMRKNKACNFQVLVDTKQGDDFYNKTGTHFIRKGEVGDHKNYMSQEMIERFDKWIDENTKGTDLTF